VKGDSNNVESELPRELEQALAALDGRAKLETEPAERLGVVGKDSKDELRGRVVFGDLEKLVGVVECHGIDAERLGGSDEGDGLAGVGEDDSGGWRRGGEGEDSKDLGLGGTVEARPEESKKLDDEGVGVAFDGWRGKGKRAAESVCEIFSKS
jgi:hypothetical protein